jgi:long-chain fatty acid transport protein
LRRTARALLSLAAALALVPCAPIGRAHAGPMLESFGAPTGLGGLTARVASPSAPATYFNPALLPEAREGLELGALVLEESIDIRLDARPPGGRNDVPGDVGHYVLPDQGDLPSRPLPTSSLEQGDADKGTSARPRGAQSGGRGRRTYLGIGLVKQLVRDRLTLGAIALMPTSGLVAVRAHFSDEREQYFSNSLRPELYGERLGVASLAFGLGLRVTRTLSLGASASLSLANSATARSYVASAAELDQAEIDIAVRARPRLAPQLGLVYTPHPRLGFTLTAHGPESVRVRSSFTNLLSSGEESGARRSFVFGYVPWRASVGVRVGLFGGPNTRAEGTLAALVELAHYRSYRDSHDEPPSRDYRFRDVVVPSIGLKLRRGSVAGFIDGSVVPTPVPPQTGRTNYVDMNRCALGLGLEYRFSAAGLAYKLGVTGQLGVFSPRYQKKRSDGGGRSTLVVDEVPDEARDASKALEPAAGAAGLQTNNPGFPGFSSRGLLGLVGVSAGVGF